MVSPSIVRTAPRVSGSKAPQGICQIVGWVCLIGFAVDMLVLVLPPSVRNLQWRIGVMQQFSDRSIILLLGAALLMFSFINNRRLLKPLALLSMTAGVAMLLSLFVVINDTVALKDQAVANIGNQATQILDQLQAAQANPSQLGEQVTPGDIESATQQLVNQSDTLKRNAQVTAYKSGVLKIGNIVVVGVGLIALGRSGLSLK